MVGGQVTGKRFGIIGMGRVGQVAAKRARGFDMAVHYTNRRRLDAAAEAPLGATYHATIEDLLPQCDVLRSEEHTSELQSLMRISYAVFCLKKKRSITIRNHNKT